MPDFRGLQALLVQRAALFHEAVRTCFRPAGVPFSPPSLFHTGFAEFDNRSGNDFSRRLENSSGAGKKFSAKQRKPRLIEAVVKLEWHSGRPSYDGVGRL